MTKKSKAVYLGNTEGEYYGFTVGNEYDVHNYETEDNFIGTFGDDGGYRHIKNGAFHKFELLEDYDFVTESECAVMPLSSDKQPELRYFINGHEFNKIEFENVRYTVNQLDEGGVKCDTIKFEVKFE
ncbi:hypothetical protein bas01_0005 [Escherichia phage AugustePiccard]|uniref:Uncharacterized protein n=1 Tax=Escherichia phage AugustePiccard TaxID=2851954 RepID=A0AAE8AX93_9CAUD|nr:hypothetical protein bas01_0005 [Escherichia phage AugustePiccard]